MLVFSRNLLQIRIFDAVCVFDIGIAGISTIINRYLLTNLMLMSYN